jgi:hypothetical protein
MRKRLFVAVVEERLAKTDSPSSLFFRAKEGERRVAPRIPEGQTFGG